MRVAVSTIAVSVKRTISFHDHDMVAKCLHFFGRPALPPPSPPPRSSLATLLLRLLEDVDAQLLGALGGMHVQDEPVARDVFLAAGRGARALLDTARTTAQQLAALPALATAAALGFPGLAEAIARAERHRGPMEPRVLRAVYWAALSRAAVLSPKDADQAPELWEIEIASLLQRRGSRAA